MLLEFYFFLGVKGIMPSCASGNRLDAYGDDSRVSLMPSRVRVSSPGRAEMSRKAHRGTPAAGMARTSNDRQSI